MSKSFKSKETETLFQGRFFARLPQSSQRTLAVKLKMLNAASIIETMRIPHLNYWEVLPGDREGRHSIRINKQWRIRFVRRGHDAYFQCRLTTNPKKQEKQMNNIVTWFERFPVPLHRPRKRV